MKSATVRLRKVSVPAWKGLPQPAGGFPLPSDSGLSARQNAPRILAHLIPQCVYRRYEVPCSAAIAIDGITANRATELTPATPIVSTKKSRTRDLIACRYYVVVHLASHGIAFAHRGDSDAAHRGAEKLLVIVSSIAITWPSTRASLPYANEC